MRRFPLVTLVVLFGFVGLAAPAVDAGEPAGSTISTDAVAAANPVDTAWLLVCSALVLMMTAPGLALFYGGLVRKKNILGVLMQCLFLVGLMSLVWAIYGYSLAFGGDMLGGIVGNLDFVFLRGVIPSWAGGTEHVPLTGSSPHQIPLAAHMIFQMMFFIITPALICGAFAERMKFSSMCIFSVLWGTFVYCPLAHWIWSDTGCMSLFNAKSPLTVLDYAGGAVVHLSSGIAALVCAVVIGPRRGYGKEAMPPHNLAFTVIGAALLWVGWFGFNAGSALAVNAAAVNAFIATHLAGAAGLLGWVIVEWKVSGKPTILGACTGAIAGLAGVTPACGFIHPMAGLLIGGLAGVVCYFMCTTVKARWRYDDSLDVFGVHGTCGILGLILAGVLATQGVTGPDVPGGLVDGHLGQLGHQFAGLVATLVLSAVGTLVILKALEATIGLRLDHDQELEGLDLSQHGEEGYIFL